MNIFIKAFRLVVNTKRKLKTVCKNINGYKSEITEWAKIINQIILIVKFVLYLIKR